MEALQKEVTIFTLPVTCTCTLLPGSVTWATLVPGAQELKLVWHRARPYVEELLKELRSRGGMRHPRLLPIERERRARLAMIKSTADGLWGVSCRTLDEAGHRLLQQCQVPRMEAGRGLGTVPLQTHCCPKGF